MFDKIKSSLIGLCVHKVYSQEIPHWAINCLQQNKLIQIVFFKNYLYYTVPLNSINTPKNFEKNLNLI